MTAAASAKNARGTDSDRQRLHALIKERSFGRGNVVLASGRASNFYFDMKRTMFHPEAASLLARMILARLAGERVDAVGGLELGAVPLVACVAALSHVEGTPLAGFFVRKTVKDHGTRKRIEGLADLRAKRVAILEDVTTTGGSALQAVEAVRDAGATPVLVLTMVDRQEGAAESFAAAGVPFASLFTAAEFLRD